MRRGISEMPSQHAWRTDPDGKIKATPPFSRFAVVGQWVTACRRKAHGAAFPEKPIESTRIAPPTGFSGSAFLV